MATPVACRWESAKYKVARVFRQKQWGQRLPKKIIRVLNLCPTKDTFWTKRAFEDFLSIFKSIKKYFCSTKIDLFKITSWNIFLKWKFHLYISPTVTLRGHSDELWKIMKAKYFVIFNMLNLNIPSFSLKI